MGMGSNIKKRRKEVEWTQLKLAQEANLSQCYISQLEKGEKNPTKGAIESIAEALGLTLGELMGEGEPDNEKYSNSERGDRSEAQTHG